jgi:hypothetical protein
MTCPVPGDTSARWVSLSQSLVLAHVHVATILRTANIANHADPIRPHTPICFHKTVSMLRNGSMDCKVTVTHVVSLNGPV